MSDLTKLFHHTGTTSQTNIGPADGGVLRSVLYNLNGSSGFITIRDGNNVIAVLKASTSVAGNSVKWEGAKLDGQLSAELSDAGHEITIEMSELL